MSREFQFENEKTICWKTTIAPNNPLKMHRHDRYRLVVAIKGGKLLKTEENGRTSELTFETGRAYYLGPDPENELHADVNVGEEDVVVVVCEFKNEGEADAGLRNEECGCGSADECGCGKFKGFRIEGIRASDNWEPSTVKK